MVGRMQWWHNQPAANQPGRSVSVPCAEAKICLDDLMPIPERLDCLMNVHEAYCSLRAKADALRAIADNLQNFPDRRRFREKADGLDSQARILSQSLIGFVDIDLKELKKRYRAGRCPFPPGIGPALAELPTVLETMMAEVVPEGRPPVE
jgi:hypothetical protein